MLSYGTIYYAVQGSSNFLVCWMKSYGVSCGATIQMKATEHFVYYAVTIVLSFNRGGTRGRVQDDLRFSNTTGILQKKTMWFIGVEVEQETSAPPPKKNPGSAPVLSLLDEIAYGVFK